MGIIYVLHRFLTFIVLHWDHTITSVLIPVRSNIKTWLLLVFGGDAIHILCLGNDKTEVSMNWIKLIGVTFSKISAGIDRPNKPWYVITNKAAKLTYMFMMTSSNGNIYWTFVRRIHRSPVNSPNKGHWRGAIMFSLICAWKNGWVNSHETGDWRHRRAHYDVTVMYMVFVWILNFIRRNYKKAW